MTRPLTPRQVRIDALRKLRARIDHELATLEAADQPPPIRRSRKVAPECGTESSYQAHRYKGEDCAPCRAAHAAHERAAEARRRIQRAMNEAS